MKYNEDKLVAYASPIGIEKEVKWINFIFRKN